MSLALLTRGYICLAAGAIPPGAQVGPGPNVVDVDDLAPVIDRIKTDDGILAPEICAVLTEDDD